MYKTRGLLTPDQGYFPDQYCNSSGGSLPFFVPYVLSPDVNFSRTNMVADFKTVSRGQIVTCQNAMSGVEEIWSTEFRKPTWNECIHSKLSLRQIGYGTALKWLTGGNGDYYFHGKNAKYPFDSLIPSLKGYQLAQSVDGYLDCIGAQRRAWGQMQPRFSGEVSMINFLFELKDFKTLAKNLVHNVKRLVNDGPGLAIFENTYKAKKYITDLGPKKLAEDSSLLAAEAVLTYNYAVRPTMADIGAILVNLQTRAQKAQDEFLAKSLESRTTHYSEILSRITPLVRVPYPDHLCFGEVNQVKFTASLERTYSYRPRGAYETFMSYWGLNVTPEALWNMIPFSFLLDYVCQVGKSLHRSARDNHVDLNVRQYAESFLSEASRGAYVYPVNKAYYTDGLEWVNFEDQKASPRHVTGIKSTIYRRRIVPPNMGMDIPKVKLPTTEQSINIAALLRCFI